MLSHRLMRFPAVWRREETSGVACLRRSFLSVADRLAAAVVMALFAGRFAAAQPYIYVPNQGVRTILVIDIKTNALVASVPNPGGYPNQAAFTPDGKILYVASESLDGSGSVSVFDPASNAISGLIAVGSQPQAVAVTADGQFAYVTNRGDNSVSVIRTATQSVIATIPVGLFPWGISASPDGSRMYVANQGGNSLSVIRTASNTVVDTWTLDGGVRETAVNPAATVLVPPAVSALT